MTKTYIPYLMFPRAEFSKIWCSNHWEKKNKKQVVGQKIK